MTKSCLSKETCKEITEYALENKEKTKEIGKEFGLHAKTIRRHIRGDCPHDTLSLCYVNHQEGWADVPSSETPDWGRNFDSNPYVCNSCEAVLGNDGVCGFCERFDTVHGVERDELAGFGGGVIAD